ncbi:MAG: dUTP diphosphatase [Actinomycetota bacterium]
MPTVRVLRLDQDLPLPQAAKLGDAGVDLRAATDAIVPPLGRVTIGTGIAIALPEGFAGFVIPRSGLAKTHGITCLNAPGLIDSGYRGEIACILHNADPDAAFGVKRGDRIAQLVIMAVESTSWLEVDNLEATERGDGGFGHTGKM